MKLFPTRLAVAVTIASWFIHDYYQRYCELGPDGTWISKAIREPDKFKSVIVALFPRWFLPVVGLPDEEMLKAQIMWSMGQAPV